MSEMSERARSQAKSKVERITRADPHAKVDASSWSPSEAMDADVQTGPRPISRRQFKRGGKVHGEASKMHAGRKPRKSGGALTADSLINRDMKAANQEREGTKHIGGMKRGGRAHKTMGGLALPAWSDSVQRKAGGKVHADAAEDKKLIHAMGCKCAKCSGGRVGRDAGGRLGIDRDAIRVGNAGSSRAAQGLAQSAMRMTSKQGTDPYNSQPSQAKNYKSLWAMKGGRPDRKAGGSVSDGALEGTRPAGGRLARKGGGRAKKGMNVNIIIAPSQAKPMMPPPGVLPAPGGGPVGLHQGAAPPMPPAGAAAPMGPAGMPPMARKSGGRAYPIDAGAGSGLGRLEKAKAAAYA